MNALAWILGLGTSLGLVMAASALWPPKPSLDRAVAAFQTRDDPHTGMPRRSLLSGRFTAADTACLGMQLEQVNRRLIGVWIGIGATGGAAVLAAAVTGWSGWPLLLFLTVAAGGAVPSTAAAILHSRAERDRAEYRRVIGVVEDVIAVDLAGGAGTEGALAAAVAAGQGRQFAVLREVLDRARLTQQPVWEALRDFGARINLPAASDLGGVIGLAATEGAQIRETMTRRVESGRATEMAEAEHLKATMTEHMSVALVLFVAALVIRFGVPQLMALANAF